MMRAVVVGLTIVVGVGCDSSLDPEPIDICAAVLSDESFFPLELGKTWSYGYDYGTSGGWNSGDPVYREEGTLLWTVAEVSCSGTNAQFRIMEEFKGVYHIRRLSSGGGWVERDTSWSDLIVGSLDGPSLTLSKYTSDSLDVQWLVPDTSVDTLRLLWTSGTMFGGEDYAQMELVRGHGITYASVGIWGRPVWWRTVNRSD